MSNKQTPEHPSDAEDLRIAVTELNQSIAYLSKMVLQLQRSINEQKPQKTNSKTQESIKKATTRTIH